MKRKNKSKINNNIILNSYSSEQVVKLTKSDITFTIFLTNNCFKKGVYSYPSLLSLKKRLSPFISPRTVDNVVKKYVWLTVLKKQKLKCNHQFILQPNNPFFRLLIKVFLRKISFGFYWQKQSNNNNQKDDSLEQRLVFFRKKLSYYLKLLINQKDYFSSFCSELLEECILFIRTNDIMERKKLETALKELIFTILVFSEGHTFKQFWQEIESLTPITGQGED